jgi:2-phospho-L-lactate guanylyltransferase (CobY/MobA/RfbA family)
MHLPRLALDIDTPDDLARFLTVPSRTRARAVLDRWTIRAEGTTAELEKVGA